MDSDRKAAIARYYDHSIFGQDIKSNTFAGFVGPSMTEVGQFVGATTGTGDPKDFIAYGIGTTLYYLVQRVKNRSNKDANSNIFDSNI